MRLHVTRGIFTAELAEFIVQECERQLHDTGRSITLVDGSESTIYATEFREAMTRWFCAHEEAIVHMLVRSDQVQMALGIANLAMATPRAVAYSSVEEWERAGRALVPSFVRRPLSIPADFQSGAWVAAVEALAAGDGPNALHCAFRAVEVADLIGLDVPRAATRCLYGRVLIEHGRFADARISLDEALALARRSGSTASEGVSLLLLAELESRCNRDAACVPATLARALTLSREAGVLDTPWLSKASIADLCVLALEAGIEVDYVRRAIRALDLHHIHVPSTSRAGPGAFASRLSARPP